MGKKQRLVPWREGNRFELLVDGPQFFPVMLRAIEQARCYVLLEMYLFESGAVGEQFVRALCEAQSRGVAVYVLIDDFGSLNLTRKDRQRLESSGVKLVSFNPIRYRFIRSNLFRNHRKLLLVDGELAFVGGFGITDDFSPADGSLPWHETAIAIRGPNVLDWKAVFVRTWNQWAEGLLSLPDVPAQCIKDGALGRISLNGLPTIAIPIKRSVLKQVRSARDRVWMATAYFIPPIKLRRTLRQAARRGVDVRLLLTGKQTDHPSVRLAGRRFYSRLLHAGVRIYEYQPRFLHAKVMLCDDWVAVGSSNADRWNLRWNLEANQEVRQVEFARTVQAWFERDFEQSVEYSYESWRHRGWWARFQEHFWGRVDLWIDRLIKPKHSD